MAKKAGMEWSEHAVLGDELKRIREGVIKRVCELSRCYGKTHIITRKAIKVEESISELKHVLDNIVGVDCPDRTREELNHCYYGAIDE